MKKLVALAAVGALGLASTAALSTPANAAPLPLINASYWCGPGWRPDAWGPLRAQLLWLGLFGGALGSMAAGSTAASVTAASVADSTADSAVGITASAWRASSRVVARGPRSQSSG